MKRYKRIYLEITNICNLNCSFCPIQERDKNQMELEKIESCLEQISPLTEQICLHLMGEPLAHTQINQILDLADKYQAKIQLTTNGLLLKKYTKLILSSICIRQVNISAQSFLDNYPEKNFIHYLEDIYLFIDTARKARDDLYLNIRLWNLVNDSNSENEAVFQFLEDKLDLTINRKLELGRIKSKKLTDKLYLHFDSRFEWPRLESPYQSSEGRCNGLIDHFAIHSDGTVVPCCLDDQKILKLGNLFEESIEDILSSDKARTIVNGFKNNSLCEELCQKCSYINRFKK